MCDLGRSEIAALAPVRVEPSHRIAPNTGMRLVLAAVLTMLIAETPAMAESTLSGALPKWSDGVVSVSDWSVVLAGPAVVVLAKAAPMASGSPVRRLWLRYENQPSDGDVGGQC
jgi:hypothetical protein